MFKVGQWVVYPAHGVGRVTAIEPPSVTNEELYRIHFERDRMTLFVPTRHKDRLRPLVKKPELGKALTELTKRRERSRLYWHLKEASYNAQLNSGDITKLTILTRNLFALDTEQPSYREVEIYDDALARLADEVALVLDLPLQGMRGLLESSIINREIAAELKAALKDS